MENDAGARCLSSESESASGLPADSAEASVLTPAAASGLPPEPGDAPRADHRVRANRRRAKGYMAVSNKWYRRFAMQAEVYNARAGWLASMLGRVGVGGWPAGWLAGCLAG